MAKGQKSLKHFKEDRSQGVLSQWLNEMQDTSHYKQIVGVTYVDSEFDMYK